MIILSNGYPTNMPNSEEVSQGGPANFARLFSSHIVAATPHKWIGVMFYGSKSKDVRLNKCFSFPQRDYFKLYLPKRYFRLITRAEKFEDPSIILRKPTKRLVSFIKKEKPDVVFLNGFGILNWMLLKAAEETGVPVVIQHAGIWTKELRLHKHLYSRAGLKIMEQMEKDSTKLSSIEVFLNTWSRDYYQKHVAHNSESKTSIIPLPFNFDFFADISKAQKKSILNPAQKAFKIGTIARWDRIKNHNAILSLAKNARKKGLAWQFYAVTQIPEVKQLKNKKRAYEKNIKVIRSLDRVGISDFCHAMDMLILPSLFDVSPTVVLEAISTGTPVAVSPNVGYVDDFRKNGAEAWVIDFKNTKKALNRIKKLAMSPMPKALQKEIKSKHEHARVFSAYLGLFDKVTSEKDIFPVIQPRAVPSLESII
jgi:glycosyltransferase involved in cell wall biosynthesis